MESAYLTQHSAGVFPSVGPLIVDSILYLTDFSPASKSALALAVRVARATDAKIHVLHVSRGAGVRARHACAASGTEKKEDSSDAAVDRAHMKLEELPYRILTEKAGDVWSCVQKTIVDFRINLLVLGLRYQAHGQELSRGTVADEIFLRSPIPLLTIRDEEAMVGRDGSWFQRALVATDLALESEAAVSFAASLAQRNQAFLTLLHARQQPTSLRSKEAAERSAAEVYHKLYESLPAKARVKSRANLILAYGNPAEVIVQTAEETQADLIVLGVCTRSEHAEKGQTLSRKTARQVAAFATCPVLTLCGI